MNEALVTFLRDTLITSGVAVMILFGFSRAIGKMWANNLIEKLKHNHAIELEKITKELQRESDEKLTSITHEFEILKNTHLREHSDKLIIYRTAMELVATMLAKLELIVMEKRPPLTDIELETFEAERLRIYAYLAMLAPQEVMDANDNLTDLLLEVVHQNKQTDWITIRGLALKLINSMRRDIGLNKTPIQYNGEL
ncbi:MULTISPECIES: hypothetical protein [unclassified Methylophaga]|uniref:hypothetical protein n=1 Tax=unclassified Methylophaga TaxID=2629249 RepID=UPI000C912234|nr:MULTISPECIES: hypothetical protein [unclassified Methylophaga]MBN46061.1 hypothetical protein [Methylophaga sp.]|tara:strand:- start:102065 stop:102655 length:591 start_codon:yes stop_codon:yes gene_type:complete